MAINTFFRRLTAWLFILACLLALGLPQAHAKQAPGLDVVSSAIAEVALAELPPEAKTTLLQIKQGGPFPYAKDGSTFRNREGLLPRQARGYYREYTVPTPGAKTRGARRIVAGSHSAGEFYYTGDHYRSFRRIKE